MSNRPPMRFSASVPGRNGKREWVATNLPFHSIEFILGLPFPEGAEIWQTDDDGKRLNDINHAAGGRTKETT